MKTTNAIKDGTDPAHLEILRQFPGRVLDGIMK